MTTTQKVLDTVLWWGLGLYLAIGFAGATYVLVTRGHL